MIDKKNPGRTEVRPGLIFDIEYLIILFLPCRLHSFILGKILLAEAH